MASILRFIKPQDGYFDDEATRVMGEAFDAARKQIEGSGQVFYETVAARIIAGASKGERDPDCLREAALTGFRYESKAG